MADELPGWTFTVDELSAGVYRVEGRDAVGRTVSMTGTDPERLLADAQSIRLYRRRHPEGATERDRHHASALQGAPEPAGSLGAARLRRLPAPREAGIRERSDRRASAPAARASTRGGKRAGGGGLGRRRALIEQAKGDPDAPPLDNAGRGFKMLRDHSQHNGRKLSAAAAVEGHLLLLPRGMA
jgi:hypothetical protein